MMVIIIFTWNRLSRWVPVSLNFFTNMINQARGLIMTTVNTQIPNRERLIFALDVPSLEEAQTLISRLGDSIEFYKLGLEVFLSGHYFELMAELKGKGKKVFADLKLFDIPATVAAAVRQLALHEVDFCTVHGNDSMLKAAADAKGQHADTRRDRPYQS